MHEQTFVTDLV